MQFSSNQEFVKAVYPAAQEMEMLHGIPALFTTAQAALESGWGKSAIGYNLFGIKAGRTWLGKKKLVKTTEYLKTNTAKFPVIHSIEALPNGKYKYVVEDWFRDYDSLYACLEDHARVLMQPNFKHAIGIKDVYEYAKSIQDPVKTKGMTYATAPNYAEAIRDVAKTVQKYLK
jgi:flagellum-specific peptidoglycan hydrolase FlgJ